jgi:Na+/proline symporter/nitrogen-specific signal transduction histidine kinase
MLATGTLVAIALAYLGLLFLIAAVGDVRAAAGRSPLANPWVYSLSLAVYCTAWTFYGSVGRAAGDGYGFLPVYLGPTLGAALGWVVYRKIVRISKAERLISIADFVASRYGKSTGLGALAAVVLVVGTVPYIALQLKAVSSSFLTLWQRTHTGELAADRLSLACAGVLALFAILFGTRSVDLTEQHAGLVLAIAFESLVKLVAFLAVGVFVVWGMFDGLGDIFARASERPDLAAMLTRSTASDGDWVWMTLLSLLAFWFLPRQFQVAVVENVDERHLKTSSWLLPLYLLVINLFVLPIALAGRLELGSSGVAADGYVLALPLLGNHESLAVLVFLGGLSAATGMIIVESLALSNMVANDLVLPVLLRRKGPAEDFRFPLLVSRRLAIAGVVLLGHLYAVSATAGASLVSIGLISFAAVAQLAPATLGGLYWAGATRRGAISGIVGGTIVWGYTLPLPTLAGGPLLAGRFVAEGPFGLSFLRPQALFGLDGMDPLSHSLLWSLLANLVLYVGVSTFGGQSSIERRQAQRFVGAFAREPGAEPSPWAAATPVAAVRGLLGRFIGEERADRALAAWAEEQKADLARDTVADPELLAFAERLLAGTTGAASARVALASVASEHALGVGEVVELLDETSRVLAASRELEEKSRELEAASAELHRVNDRLQELDRRKDEFLSTMAHELRTPLAAVRAFAEILHDNPDLGIEQRREFLGIIARENERLTRLIQGLLDLAKLEAEGDLESPEPVLLDEVVRDAAASMGQLATTRGARLELDLPPSESRVDGDRDRLVQVVINLLSNAFRHVEPGSGLVRVSLDGTREAVRLAVSDNGPGIPEELRETVFERFRQLPRGGPDRRHGAGLGLAISRRIVEQHGGSIRAEASELGGARFVVRFPVSAARDTGGATAAPGSSAQPNDATERGDAA